MVVILLWVVSWSILWLSFQWKRICFLFYFVFGFWFSLENKTKKPEWWLCLYVLSVPTREICLIIINDSIYFRFIFSFLKAFIITLQNSLGFVSSFPKNSFRNLGFSDLNHEMGFLCFYKHTQIHTHLQIYICVFVFFALCWFLNRTILGFSVCNYRSNSLFLMSNFVFERMSFLFYKKRKKKRISFLFSHRYNFFKKYSLVV